MDCLADDQADELLRLATDLYATPEPHPPLPAFIGMGPVVDPTSPSADALLDDFGRQPAGLYPHRHRRSCTRSLTTTITTHAARECARRYALAPGSPDVVDDHVDSGCRAKGRGESVEHDCVAGSSARPR